MSFDPSPSVREELPRHTAWMRRLSARLVRDEHTAEDLAQETVLAALRARRPIRGALQLWLARVATNLARRGWRAAETRRRGEGAAARVEELPAPEETLGRLEIQEQLAAVSRPALRLYGRTWIRKSRQHLRSTRRPLAHRRPRHASAGAAWQVLIPTASNRVAM